MTRGEHQSESQNPLNTSGIEEDTLGTCRQAAGGK